MVKTYLASAINKYQTDGLSELIRSVGTQFPNIVGNYIRRSRLIKGESQFDLFTNFRHIVHQYKYTIPANPWKTINVQPNHIEYRTKPLHFEWGLGRIKGGDWDSSENLIPLENHHVIKGLKERFVEKMDWEDTTYISEAKEQFSNGQKMWGYQNFDQYLQIRCQYVDELYKAINENGYRPNFMGTHDVPEVDVRHHQESSQNRLEPIICIGREGEIFLVDGFHRIALAQILDVSPIPVNVMIRHIKWQQCRDAIYTHPSAQVDKCPNIDYKSHPDLADLINS